MSDPITDPASQGSMSSGPFSKPAPAAPAAPTVEAPAATVRLGLARADIGGFVCFVDGVRYEVNAATDVPVDVADNIMAQALGLGVHVREIEETPGGPTEHGFNDLVNGA